MSFAAGFAAGCELERERKLCIAVAVVLAVAIVLEDVLGRELALEKGLLIAVLLDEGHKLLRAVEGNAGRSVSCVMPSVR